MNGSLHPTKKRRMSSRRSRREPENSEETQDVGVDRINSTTAGTSMSHSISTMNQDTERMELEEEEQGPQPQVDVDVGVEVDAVPIPGTSQSLTQAAASSGVAQQQQQIMEVAIIEGPSRRREEHATPPPFAGPLNGNDNRELAVPHPLLLEIGAGEPSPSHGLQIQNQQLPQRLQQQLQLLPSPSLVNGRPEEVGWQESRGLLNDRAAYLLNNSRMSDVRFLVGEGKVEMFGHKTILAMGSGVFEAQFFGSLSTSDVNVIELPDFEPQTFLLFLKYLYTDTLDEPIDDVKVLNLIKPAKKYIVPHLIEKCSDILMSELRPENIFQVHNYADFFDLSKLGGACLRFIDRESEAIVQTEEFTMLNSETLASFLRRDGLNISEIELFKAVLRWAEFECERNNIEPTDTNIRDVLAENLRLIRFPTMTPEEFATEVAPRNILSAEEARSIFIYMCSGYQNRMNPAFVPHFPISKRGFYPQQYLVSRFGGDPTPHSLNYRSGEIYTYRFNIKSDRQIFFKGVNIFSIKCLHAQYAERRGFNGAVYLYECDTDAGDRDLSREKGRKSFSRDGSLESEFETTSGSRFFPVLFDTEVRIPANQTFTVCAVVSVASSGCQQQPLNTFMGMDEQTEVSVRCADNLIVNFTFSNSAGENSVGKYTQSQIPEIVFSL